MNNTWQSHLMQQGAQLSEGRVAHFGDAARERSLASQADVIADLSHYGLISAQGADSQTFLQGQLTNDVRAVNTEQSQLTAYCNPKGRMLASLRLFRREPAYYLELPVELLAPTLKRLRMFVLRSQITLEDASDALARFGLAGPGIPALLARHFPAVPEEPDAALQHEQCTLLRLPGPQPRFEVHGPAEALIPLWMALREQATPVGDPAWAWLDIAAGIPWVSANTVEAFVPQMTNLHSLNGINFRKGCYTGQEVVARMHYLGKLKRRMYRAHIASDQVPEPGTPLYGGSGADEEQSAGKVVSAQPAPQGGVDLLAVLQIASVEAGPVHLNSAEGPQLELLDLPYTVEGQ